MRLSLVLLVDLVLETVALLETPAALAVSSSLSFVMDTAGPVVVISLLVLLL